MTVAGRVLSSLAATTRFGDLRSFATIDSTNRWVRARADEGAPEGLVAVADHQSEGRGRLGRTWDAPPGSGLLMSVLLRPRHLPPHRGHLVTAAVALSAAEACEEVAGFRPDLKWPNDLLVEDRKLAGVLAESTGDAVVVGIGLNLGAAPDGAATAEGAAGRPVPRDEVLLALLTALERRLRQSWDAVADEHRDRCSTIGRRVRVELHDRTVTGEATDLDANGCLLLRTDGGERMAVSAGDVVHLRPSEGGDPPAL